MHLFVLHCYRKAVDETRQQQQQQEAACRGVRVVAYVLLWRVFVEGRASRVFLSSKSS